jgi:SAM-dependent methyltransferase
MNPHSIFNLYWLSQTLITAVRLGIFDQLARGPQTGDQVAQALGLNRATTERLLAALAAMGVVYQQGQIYGNTPDSSMALVSSSPWSVAGIADHHAEQLWPLWEHLPTAIREGRPVLQEAFGGTSNPFDVLTSSPDALRKLLAGMHFGAMGLADALRLAHDFRGHRHLLDVGGGTGIVSGTLAQYFPHLRATILELPQVCAALPDLLRGYRCGDRISAHPGDMFDADTYPQGCDCAVLCRVLHDWSDDKARSILRNVHRALVPGGIVLVVESLLDTADPSGRLFAALSDLTMLVLTDGGRERTAAEYEALLREAGFHTHGTTRSMGPVAVIKAQKPTALYPGFEATRTPQGGP